MTHPSIIAARAAIARIDAKLPEHERWHREHADEFDDARLNALIMRKALPIVRKVMVDQHPQGGRRFRFSDGSIDSYGDILEQRGWQLDRFKKNPVTYFNHNPSFIVGRWPRVAVEGDALYGDLQLAPLGTSDRVDEIIRLVEANLIVACSVGFLPLASTPLPSGGKRYTKMELCECSLVGAGANANALSMAKSLGISDATQRLVFPQQPPLTEVEVLADELGALTGRMERKFNDKLATIQTQRGASADLTLYVDEQINQLRAEMLDYIEQLRSEI